MESIKLTRMLPPTKQNIFCHILLAVNYLLVSHIGLCVSCSFTISIYSLLWPPLMSVY